ncbi:AcrR family transcriptional regulator [Nocardioides luteus]|uniref:TetR family transcriptional regulator n=1 Tax=Nocardioides luteus TaxID=1844 RepID=A0ABQ5SZT1_9ACTN|nr:TetR/AcrR family transcriptional regulator [Nocardioides luteus]MDR7312851.1 AcrR family transcriptional regulator [Nocardioides luteus]GGR48034.1 TetR family transcriptional regulator [Nocardioides luteus]GLJ69105.1 TetR family transcriptional regulator [Nocardioides luteus]
MSADRATYHHGNLRSALIDAAWEMARSSAPEKVTLREVARRVGVSHNAAYRHFADRQELMRSLADRAVEELTARMQARNATVSDDREPAEIARARFKETARAYVAFATDEPHLFQMAFHLEFSGPDVVPVISERRDGPYGILNDVLDEMVAVGEIPAERRLGAEVVCWAAVHGFAELCTKGPLGRLPAPEREATLDLLFHTLQQGLKAPVG